MKTRRIRPTPAQHETLAAIEAHIARHGYPPAHRELAEALCVSLSAATGRVDTLVRHGLIRNEGRRGLVPIAITLDLSARDGVWRGIWRSVGES